MVVVLGATRQYALVLHAHIAASALGAALLLAHVWRTTTGDGGRVWAVRAGLIAVVAARVTAPMLRATRDAEWRQAYRIENPTRPPASMADEGAGAASPFAPSSADTNTGGLIPADFFLTSESCGRCHRDIFDQWNSSAHHFSSFNNQWYRRSIEYMQDVVGTTPSKWCAGCHDHAVFFNGRFDQPIREQIDTPEAQAGLSCTSCHTIVHVGSSMGQGEFVIEYPPLHDLAASDNPFLRGAHDLLINLAPGPHRETFLKPFHKDQGAEFCATCHKVHLDVPVNAYRWIRGFNEYDNWQASGVSGQGARSFYYRDTPKTCGSCHMPLVRSDDPAADDGYVRSHRFPGANTALPFVNRDAEQLKVVQDFLRADQISIDVFGITRVADTPPLAARAVRSSEPTLSSTFAVGEESLQFGAGRRLPGGPTPAEVIAPLDQLPVSVRRGESIRVEVVVRTRNVGHFFPGGTVDSFDVWVEFEAVDGQGRVLLHSGVAEDEGSGPVDPGTHFYRSLQLDGHGNPINKRNAWMTRSVAYVRLIPPGAADTVHYRLQIPEDAGERIILIDEAPRSQIGRATRLTLTFGCFFFDFDLDGWPDIFAANGHVADDVERVQSRVTYAQRPQLFRNFGQGDFEEIVASDRSALQTPMVGRGAAYADADNDGDLDVLVTANGGPARLLRNDGGNANHVLRVRTIGTASNRDGIGARVEVRAGGDTRWQTVKTGSSYLSQSELTLTFGLGPAATLSTVRVAWPSGQVDTVDDVDADQTITIEEGAGLVAAMPIVVRR